MNYLYVCNTSSDNISKIDHGTFLHLDTVELGKNYTERIGPHGICVYNDYLLVANSYSNSLSFVDLKSDKETESFYIGVHCNDVKVLGNKAYIVCGDSNCIITFDLIKKVFIEQIPCGNMPHSIDIDIKNKRLVVTNFGSDSLTIIDCSDLNNIKNTRVGAYPTKALFSFDGEYIIVCESNLGGYERGNLNIMNSQNLKNVNRIQVGFSPVDMCCDSENCYVSNFGEGTISIVNINDYRHLNKINVGGMPRGIVKVGQYLYIGDNYNNQLIKLDIIDEIKKAICIGGEPTGMALI